MTFGALIIVSAQHGGFAVMRDIGGHGEMRPLLFAGSLVDTLEFLRTQMAQPLPDTTEGRR